MGSFQNFILRMEAGGDSMRNEQIQNAAYLVQQTFADDPSYIPEGVRIYNTNRVIHPRIYLHKFRTTSPAHANIQTQIHEPFYLGDIIPWPNHGYWLCMDSNNLHGIQWEGTLQFCNHTIRFRSSLNGEIVEYPVSLINATQYGSGETGRQFVTLGTSQLVVYISYDEHTILLDNGVRFLIDRNKEVPTAFEIKQADTVSYSDGGEHGYIQLTVLESPFNPQTDNKDLMIANYYENPIGTGEELKEDQNYSWI